MKRIESELEKKCSQYARERGWASVKLEKNWNKGVPDRLFVKNDKVFFVEFKKDKNSKLSKEQLFWKNFIAPLYFVIYDFHSFTEIIFLKE
jgi:Holliday junction resolvase